MTKIYKFILIVSATIVINSCGGGGGGISVLPTTDAFDETELNFNPKMDILWVVDPSRSMKSNVKSINDNIQDFVTDFVTKGYEYQMGVISTAAWAKLVTDASAPAELSVFGKLHQGECVDPGYVSNAPILRWDNVSGIPDFVTKFQKNFDLYGLALNTSSCGLDFFTDYADVPGNFFAGLTPGQKSEIGEYVSDERPLQSLRTFLDSADGESFLRPDAFLAVIIISDEIDASRDSLVPSLSFDPEASGNHEADEYIDFLTTLKEGDTSKFAVYSITDQSLETGGVQNISRVAAEHPTSGGVAFDIAASSAQYKENLNTIKGEILTLASIYPLNREPRVETITIEVIKTSGVVVSVPQSDSEGAPGWSYDPDHGEYGAILFSGEEYIPSQGDGIVVNYTPANLNAGEIKEPYINISNNSIEENSPTDGSAVVGTVSLFNQNLASSDTVHYEILTEPSSFDIDALTGQVTVSSALDAETKFSEQMEVELVITHDDSTTTTFSRTFTIRILDTPDNSPEAHDAVFEVSESIGDDTGVVRVSGSLSYYVSRIDASERHLYSIETDPAPDGLTLLNAETGEFVYEIAKTDLGLNIGDPNFEVNFSYKVVGTNNSDDPLDFDDEGSENVASVLISISPANNSPKYETAICPEGGYDFCDGDVVKPNNEGVSFGLIPLTEDDVEVSGSFTGSKANLVGGGGAHLETGVNAQGYHEVILTFPDDKMYEVGCVRVYPDEDSSLGNAIYQVLTPGTESFAVTREVFPVGISTRSNMGNTPPTDAQGACATLSNDYFTIYTERKFIGGKLRLLRPSGSTNPQGHTSLKLDQIQAYGIEAKYNRINLLDHFDDLDIPDGDALTFYVTDAFGEGPAPGWASIDANGTDLLLLPSASVNETLGLLAVDNSGAEAFSTIEVVGSGGGSVSNAPPISLLQLDDAKRGGLSMRRWGGSGTPIPGGCSVGGGDNLIVHIEIDNFIEKPFGAATGYYDIFVDPIQAPHNGDTRSGETENGWCNEPVHEDNKYPTDSISFCNDTNFNTVDNRGKIIPCVNSARSYGEVYSGYFVPAKTGVYKFRTRVIDNTIMLRIAPTEYYEDTQKVFIANWQDAVLEESLRSLINYPTEDFGSSEAQNSEFAGTGSGTSLTSYRAIPYDTSLFFELNGISTGSNYSPGYVYLTQGNVYAFEKRFGEGGGSVSFEFEYDRKDLDGSWDGWTSMDASVVVPDRGGDSHDAFYIPVASGGVVDYEVANHFYDAEMDLLEYSARVVNADGSAFGDGSLAYIGLEIGILGGHLTGTLNSNYGSALEKPRIVLKAKERFSVRETESLPIKFSDY